MKIVCTGYLLLWCGLTAGAQTLTLDTCYSLARKNYPMVKQYELIARTREYTLENIARGHLPRININGQASYQSDVTQLPKSIPGVPVLSKDQYKIFAEADQPVYDGGILREQKKLQEATSGLDAQKLEVELYKIKDRVNQFYFGILLIDGQLTQNALMKKDIQSGLDKVNARIAAGTALRSNADILKAELLAAGQQTTALQSNRHAFEEMLSLFINRPLDEHTIFVRPPEPAPAAGIGRPELRVYDYQDRIADAQDLLLTAGNRPRLSFFVQGGFGKPAFNILSDRFDPFYIGGLRLSFPLSGFYTQKNERALLHIGKDRTNAERETFLFNTRLALKQQDAEIEKLRSYLQTDDEIIALRAGVVHAALAQLENGVINSGDYLREVDARDSAAQNKILHEIQLLMASYNEQNTSGN